MPVADLIRQIGISEQTFYRWKRQGAGLESDQVREFKQLADENSRLKKLVAELSLELSNWYRFTGQSTTTPGRNGECTLWPLTETTCRGRP